MEEEYRASRDCALASRTYDRSIIQRVVSGGVSCGKDVITITSPSFKRHHAGKPVSHIHATDAGGRRQVKKWHVACCRRIPSVCETRRLNAFAVVRRIRRDLLRAYGYHGDNVFTARRSVATGLSSTPSVYRSL